ncbi:MAG: PDDEXK nuclease domain-containing protein [Candidatus Aenigmarchaeota archaeon]|nr:PDDEXK nuclease domain-containing protein [Candidatus Aenigmarchaeota archaeon]
MVRYWIIAPYDSTERKYFDKAWNYDLNNNTIAVGWRKLGDISQYKSKEEIRKKFEQIYPNDNPSSITRDVNTIWSFYHDISIGDIIIARQGRKKIINIGQVTRTAYHNESKGKERTPIGNCYPNFIGVGWEGKNIEFDRMAFSFYTMYEIQESRFQELLKGKVSTDEDETPEQQTDEQKTELYLEKYLEEIIVRNFNALFKGELELYTDEEGNIGQQYPVIGNEGRQIGRIDILTKNPKSNDFVVIELKKGRDAGEVVGQLLGYMGWVKDNLCEKDQGVKGLIICKDKDERLNNTVKMVNNFINIKYYNLDLKLKD